MWTFFSTQNRSNIDLAQRKMQIWTNLNNITLKIGFFVWTMVLTCRYMGASNSSRRLNCCSMARFSTAVRSVSEANCWRRSPMTGSMRSIVLSKSFSLYFTSTTPSGSRTPPRESGSAYISMQRSLMVGSMTTQAPPRSSANGGMYTMIGCLYSRSPSTM